MIVVGTIVMRLAVRDGFTAAGHGRETDENCQKYDIFGSSSTYALSIGEKHFFGAATWTNHTFLNFGKFFFLSTCIFSYGLWFMVPQNEAMDHSYVNQEENWQGTHCS